MAESAVFSNSAARRQNGTDHSGKRGGLGKGRMTGHQKRSDAPRKHTCSALCHAEERSARSNAAGTCQAQSVTAIRTQQTDGRVTVFAARRNAGHVKNGPTPSR